VRLSFVPPGAHMGYPYYFKNFSEDMLQPLADYGGGSPVRALWVDEPGLQNGLYTCRVGTQRDHVSPPEAEGRRLGSGWAEPRDRPNGLN
jgi:hypothetical protein